MSHYNRQKNFIVVFFAVWFLGSLVIGHLYVRSQNIFFPFYSWRLFEKIVVEMKDYGVEVLSLDGETFDPPADFVDDIVPKDLKLIRLWSQPDRIIQRLGKANKGYDYSSFSEIKNSFEQNYFYKNQSGTYQLVRRRWDPLEAWNKKKRGAWFKEKEVIAVLKFNKKSD